jgi:hypothetical protein
MQLDSLPKSLPINQDIELTQAEIDIIIGTILGDGHIKYSNLKLSKAQVKYGYGNKTYAEFVFLQLNRLIKKYEISETNNLDSRYNKFNSCFYFSTFALDSLKKYADLFLKFINQDDTKNPFYLKILPGYEVLFQLLSTRALAF